MRHFPVPTARDTRRGRAPAPADDGRWEGWIEFSDLDTGAVIRSGRETTQPTRDDAMYWATGLTRVYLEGRSRSCARPGSGGSSRRAGRRRADVRRAGAAVCSGRASRPHRARCSIHSRCTRRASACCVRSCRRSTWTTCAAIVRAYGLEGGAAARVDACRRCSSSTSSPRFGRAR